MRAKHFQEWMQEHQEKEEAEEAEEEGDMSEPEGREIDTKDR